MAPYGLRIPLLTLSILAGCLAPPGGDVEGGDAEQVLHEPLHP